MYESQISKGNLERETQRYVIELMNDSINHARDTESRLLQMAHQQTTVFMKTLVKIITDQYKPVSLRLSICKVFKSVVNKKMNQTVQKGQNGKFVWDGVDKYEQSQIKQLLLNPLFHKDLSIVRNCAGCLAHIASIQLPRHQWLDLLHNILEAANYQDYTITLASAILLNEICSELNRTNAMIPQQSSQAIYQYFLINLEVNASHCEIALDSLDQSVVFLRGLLERSEYFAPLFQLLQSLIKLNATKVKVYQVLFQITKHCYHVLHHYLLNIMELSRRHLQQRGRQVCYPLQLWQNIAKTYLDHKKKTSLSLSPQLGNYIAEAQWMILPELLPYFSVQESQAQEIVWTRQQVLKVLYLFAECGNSHTVNIVMNFVFKNIEDRTENQISTQVIKCLKSCPKSQEISKAVCFWLFCLFTNPKMQDVAVQNRTLTIFTILSCQFSVAFVTQKWSEELVKELIHIAYTKADQSVIKALTILRDLREHTPHQSKTILDDKWFQLQIIKLFQRIFDQTSAAEERELITLLLQEIIQRSQEYEIWDNQLLDYLLSRYTSLLYKQNCTPIKQIVALIYTCLIKFVRGATHSRPKINNTDRVFTMIDKHFSRFGVEQDGVSLIGAAAMCFRQDFMHHQDHYWPKLIFAITQRRGHFKTFKAAVDSIGDILRHQAFEASGQLIQAAQILLTCLNCSIDINEKIAIFNFFGDLAHGLKQNKEPFLKQLLKLAAKYFEQFQQYLSKEESAISLYQAIIEMLHAWNIAEKSNSESMNGLNIKFFPTIFEHIVKSCDESCKPTLRYLRACLYFLFDTQIKYKGDMQLNKKTVDLLKTSSVARIIALVRRFPSQPQLQELLQYIDKRVYAI